MKHCEYETNIFSLIKDENLKFKYKFQNFLSIFLLDHRAQFTSNAADKQLPFIFEKKEQINHTMHRSRVNREML